MSKKNKGDYSMKNWRNPGGSGEKKRRRDEAHEDASAVNGRRPEPSPKRESRPPLPSDDEKRVNDPFAAELLDSLVGQIEAYDASDGTEDDLRELFNIGSNPSSLNNPDFSDWSVYTLNRNVRAPKDGKPRRMSLDLVAIRDGVPTHFSTAFIAPSGHACVQVIPMGESGPNYRMSLSRSLDLQ